MKTIKSLAAACALTSIAAPALAQEEISVHVRYGDLNLASPAGAHAFHLRLERAVTDICGSYDPRDVAEASIVAACRVETSARASRLEQDAVAGASDGYPVKTALVTDHPRRPK